MHNTAQVEYWPMISRDPSHPFGPRERAINEHYIGYASGYDLESGVLEVTARREDVASQICRLGIVVHNLSRGEAGQLHLMPGHSPEELKVAPHRLEGAIVRASTGTVQEVPVDAYTGLYTTVYMQRLATDNRTKPKQLGSHLAAELLHCNRPVTLTLADQPEARSERRSWPQVRALFERQ